MQKNIKQTQEVMAKRTAKNSVFLDLFQNRSNLLKLYKTLHPEDITATEDSLTDVTIENVLTANLYNDLGFIVNNRLMILIEAQSLCKDLHNDWTPIFDEFDACGVRLALEVHPTEIAYDYWSTKRLLETIDYRPTLGINFDPSHLIWQGIDPAVFLYDFADRIYHVHIKDAKLNLNGRNGILGSHIVFGDQRRGWNFVSPGHGDVDFDNIIRVLNQIGYDGPLSIEWEDSGMERVFGGTEACEFTKKINFSPSDVAFDDALKA